MSWIRLAGSVALVLIATACGPRSEPGTADRDTSTTTTIERPALPVPPVEVVTETSAPPETSPAQPSAGAPTTEAPTPDEDLAPKLDELDALLDDLEEMLSDAAVDEGDM